MTKLKECVRHLALDMVVFAEMLLYWPFAVLVMKPVQLCDQRLGTHMFQALDSAMRKIADL